MTKLETDGPPAWLAAPIKFEDERGFRTSRHVLRAGLVLAILALLWAGVAPIRELSLARGQLAPTSQIRPVQHLEGGIVEAILVKQGQVVEKGQPLVRLNAVMVEADLAALSARALGLALQKERAAALLAGRPADFSAFVGASPAVLAEHAQVYRLRLQHRAREHDLLRARAAQRRAEIAALENEIATWRRLVDIQAEQVQARRQLVSTGSLSRKDLLASETSFEQASVSMKTNAGKLAAAREAFAEADAALIESEAAAHKAWGEELAKVSSELSEVEETIRKHQDRIDRLVLRSPARGVVQQVLQRSSGEVVKPGETMARVVPIDEPLVAEVHVKPEDIAVIRPGDKADIKVTAFDSTRYGRIPGEVISVSPATIEQDDRRHYYRVLIRLDGGVDGGVAAAFKLQAGMVVDAEIISGRKTLLQYLLRPVYRGIDVAFSER